MQMLSTQIMPDDDHAFGVKAVKPKSFHWLSQCLSIAAIGSTQNTNSFPFGFENNTFDADASRLARKVSLLCFNGNEGNIVAVLLLVRPVKTGGIRDIKNRLRKKPLKEVEVMLNESWTMEWFAYLNAIILAWAALSYVYREYVRQSND